MNILTNKGVGNKIINSLKDIFFPAQCLSCGEEGKFICHKCFQTLDCSGVFCCPVCHSQTLKGEYCTNCKKQYLDYHVAIIKYEDAKLIGKIMHSFKYKYIEDLKDVFQKIIFEFFKNEIALNIDYIVPVPLHKRRFVERGFNQSEIIAKIVSKVLNKPVENILIRKKYTKQQAKLKRKERIENLKDAFVLKNNINLKNKKILLVDDVFTTGSTIQECAKVLKDNDAVEVVGFSVARG